MKQFWCLWVGGEQIPTLFYRLYAQQEYNADYIKRKNNMNPVIYRVRRRAFCTSISAAALALASGAVSAEPVNLELSYTCPFPLIGNQQVITNISSEMPATVESGAPTGAFAIDVVSTVPENAKIGLGLAGAVSIEGTASSDVVVELPSVDRFITVQLDIPSTVIPSGGGAFNVPASGVQEPLVFGETDEGSGVVRVEGLTLNMITRTFSGEIASDPVGEFTSVCTLDPGQDNALHTFGIIPPPDPYDPADIHLSTDNVDFGTVQAGLSEEMTIVITNDGQSPLSIDRLSLDGSSAFEMSTDCSVLAPGESCTVFITYYPSDDGIQTAVLTVASNDPDSAVLDIAIAGRSLLSGPEIVVPDEVDFGVVEIGTSVTRKIAVSNDGIESLSISEIWVTGGDAGAFVSSHMCSVVAPGATCFVSAMFAPHSDGHFSSALNIAYDRAENPAVVSLQGSGIVTDPPFIAFDVQGASTIAASGRTMALSGSIEPRLDLATGIFGGDLRIDNSQLRVPVSRLFRSVEATAKVEFEQTRESSGMLANGVLTLEASMHIKVPKVTVAFFGFPVMIGGGEACRTIDPVTISMQSPEGESFSPLRGGIITGEYYLPPLENCGALTSLLNKTMAGYGNTIQLGLTPIL
ncbi:MAG: hypothetical protein CL583_11750 [Alteromonadaceae bacterium]|nr:hypothetical protein [Alteromonadaceae bacterium]|tara:strand:+ start:6276 stop:8183 length:1908 start_codon:yes stop_codon:yes gene_type:complete